MPTFAKPKAKTKQIVAKPRPEWEIEFVAFKEICARNGLSMSEEIYERAIKKFLEEHHWPPGNSQTLLEIYDGGHEESTVMCEIECCGEEAAYKCDTIFPFGRIKNLCAHHTSLFERRCELTSKKRLGDSS